MSVYDLRLARSNLLSRDEYFFDPNVLRREVSVKEISSPRPAPAPFAESFRAIVE
jgi:hypothetical protein